MITDKDYNVVFDDTIKNENGVSVNAQISSNNSEIEIKINPNSSRAGEFLLVHEVTHGIETSNMKKLVLDFASKNPELNTALESLKQTYRTTDVNSEVLADISGQLLGNQEFINSLTTQNTVHLIKTIYESIKRLLNTLTENGRYRNFVQDLETKWREVYRTTATEQVINSLGDTKYAIETSKKFGSYWQVKTNKDIFNNIKNRKTLREKAFDYILNGNNNFKEIIDKINGKEVQFRRISAREYIYGTNAQKLSNQNYNIIINYLSKDLIIIKVKLK